jgi:hypothetical protein
MEGVTSTATRPRDVVLAAVLTIIGSVLALSGIFGAVGQLRSSRVRRELESLMAGEQFAAFDISVESLLNMLEVALMAASAASVAAIVLAVYVMRRHNPSRIALTVLGGAAAVTVLFSGLAGIAIAIFVAYTVSLLWRAPARTWFAVGSVGAGSGGTGTGAGADAGPGTDRPWWGGPSSGGRQDAQAPPESGSVGSAPPDGRPTGDVSADRPGSPESAERPGAQVSGSGSGGGGPERAQPGPYPRPWPPEQPASGRSGPHDSGQQDPDRSGQQDPHPPGEEYPGSAAAEPGYPQGHDQGYGAAPAYPHAYGSPAYPGHQGYPAYPGYPGYPSPADPDRRPPQTVAAHVLTWVGSGLGIMTGAFFVFAASSPQVIDLVMQQLPANAVPNRDDFVRSLRIGGALTALWSVAVVVVSVFSWRRARWAHLGLSVMGAAYLVAQAVSLVLMGQVAVLLTLSWVSAVIVLLWWPASRQWYAGGDTPGQQGPPDSGSTAYPQARGRNQPW